MSLKSIVVVVISVVSVASITYGSYFYGHKNGYRDAKMSTSKQIASLEKQDANDKAEASKYKDAMWQAISDGITSNNANKPASSSLHCTSYDYGPYSTFTDTTCN